MTIYDTDPKTGSYEVLLPLMSAVFNGDTKILDNDTKLPITAMRAGGWLDIEGSVTYTGTYPSTDLYVDLVDTDDNTVLATYWLGSFTMPQAPFKSWFFIIQMPNKTLHFKLVLRD